MPKINSHYCAGPLDEIVYAAADAAGLPERVQAGFDGAGIAWHWDLTPPASRVLADVVLRLTPAARGAVMLAVGVLRSAADWRQRDTFTSIARVEAATAMETDPAWLQGALARARAVAGQQMAAEATGYTRAG